MNLKHSRVQKSAIQNIVDTGKSHFTPTLLLAAQYLLDAKRGEDILTLTEQYD